MTFFSTRSILALSQALYAVVFLVSIVSATPSSNPPYFTDLQLAAYNNDAKAVLAAIRARVGLEEVARSDPEDFLGGWTPLQIAAYIGGFKVMRILLEAGAISDKEVAANAWGYFDGWTPLHIAIIRGHIGAVRLLIKASSNPHRSVSGDSSRNPGWRPMQLAALAKNPAVAMTLLELGVTRRHFNSVSPLGIVVAKGHAELTQTLLSVGWNPNGAIRNSESPFFGWKFLHVASHIGDPKVVKALIKAGARRHSEVRWDSIKFTRWRAIHIAAFFGHAEVVQTLLDAGGNPDNQISEYAEKFPWWTPLQLAAFNGKEHVAQTLLKAKADTHITVTWGRFEGYTALEIAIVQGRLNIVRLLLQAGENPARLKEHRPPLALDGNTANLLLEYGVGEVHDLETRILALGETEEALRLEVAGGYLDAATELVKTLRERRVDLTESLLSLLTRYCVLARPDSVRFIINNLKLQDAGNKIFAQALRLAFDNGFRESAKILINAGADTSLAEQYADNPYSWMTNWKVAWLKHWKTRELIKPFLESHQPAIRDLAPLIAAYTATAVPKDVLQTRRLTRQFDLGNCKRMKRALEAGANPNALHRNEQPLIWVAAEQENISQARAMIALLLEHGANPNPSNGLGQALFDHFSSLDKKEFEQRLTVIDKLASNALSNRIPVSDDLIARIGRFNRLNNAPASTAAAARSLSSLFLF